MRLMLGLRVKYANFIQHEINLSLLKFVDTNSVEEEEPIELESAGNLMFKDGVFSVSSLSQTVDVEDFLKDLKIVNDLALDPELIQFCETRNQDLTTETRRYMNENRSMELSLQRQIRGINSNCQKTVDTHIHVAAITTAMDLLNLMERKKTTNPNDIACEEEEVQTSLLQLFDQIEERNGYDLNADAMNVHADHTMFENFPMFKEKYKPFGSSQLRQIFLKTRNFNGGQYFAEWIRERMDKLPEQHQYIEPRISVQGSSHDEWKHLANWTNKHNVYSQHSKWMIQMPRSFQELREKGKVETFEEMIDKFFRSLFEATLSPEKEETLSKYLQSVVAFDLVGDESGTEPSPLFEPFVKPANPEYSRYHWHMFINTSNLNKLRRTKGMNKFAFRPHVGEAGEPHHICCGFLTSQNIAHGVNLEKSAVMKYAFYLAQIAISMSPISNSYLFKRYEENPFREFFDLGVPVTLSTDDPLMFHRTDNPLLEEFTTAGTIFRLSEVDKSELARNSIMMSGFDELKVAMNCQEETNVPEMRLNFRRQQHESELNYIFEGQTSQCS